MTNFRFSVGASYRLFALAVLNTTGCSAEAADESAENIGEATELLSVIIPAENRDDCKYPPPDGHRPLCAYTSWRQTIHQCTITDYQATTCACYEGETRSCLFSSPNTPCSPASATCGVKWCNVADDTHSTWGPCQ
jgi:hypothetical protein